MMHTDFHASYGNGLPAVSNKWGSGPEVSMPQPVAPQGAVYPSPKRTEKKDEERNHEKERIISSSNSNTLYRVIKKLGSGSYGTVYKVQAVAQEIFNPGEKLPEFALKISLPEWAFWNAQYKEERIVEILNEGENTSVVKMIEGFFHEKQRCTVYELLSQDLRDYMTQKKKGAVPVFHLSDIRNLTLQLAKGLNLLSLDRVIHGDLKPENILLVNQEGMDVRLADFGLAQLATSPTRNYSVQTIWYRAPEVAMRLDFDEKADIWSLGCVLVELYTNKALFPSASHKDLNRENKAHLLLIATTLGSLRQADFANSYLRKESDFIAQCHARNQNALTPIVLKGKALSSATEEEQLFLDLVSKMLAINPHDRLCAKDILKHPFCAGHAAV